MTETLGLAYGRLGVKARPMEGGLLVSTRRPDILGAQRHLTVSLNLSKAECSLGRPRKVVLVVHQP